MILKIKDGEKVLCIKRYKREFKKGKYYNIIDGQVETNLKSGFFYINGERYGEQFYFGDAFQSVPLLGSRKRQFYKYFKDEDQLLKEIRKDKLDKINALKKR